MKDQTKFRTGVLTGICGMLLLFLLTGVTTKESENEVAIYEFYDLKDTRGIIFNKKTGEIKYKEIRNDIPELEVQHIRVSDWNGLTDDRIRTGWNNQ
tara:strand:+ start:343 stop:633 length:291 start_codon:yes stop_codon:yes gene_type:complete